MLRLRPYKSADAEKIAFWCKDEEAYFKWSGGRFGSYPISPADIDRKYMQENGDCAEADNFYPVAACDEKGLAGQLILRYLNGDPSMIRLGWVILDPERRGQGIGKQMISLAFQYAFEILKAQKVTIGVFANNMPAYHCYRAAGFEEAAAEEESYDMIAGKKWKIIELEITREKYESNRTENGSKPEA